MRIVKKSDIDSPDKGGEVLDSALVDALQRCYVSQDPRYDDITKVQSMLRQARGSEAWVECDCKLPLSAFLFPRKLPTGAYTLARPPHTSQYTHTPECPFHHADFSAAMKVSHPNLNIYSADKNQSSLTSNMQKILVWLLSEKGLFEYPTAQTYHYIDALNQTRDYLSTLPALFDEVTPAKLISTYGKHVVPFYKRLSTIDFPTDYAPHGYVFGLANAVTDDGVELVSGAKVKVKNNMNTPKQPTGPLWCLLLVVEQGKGFFSAHSAVTLPAYSIKQPYGLSDGVERDVFKQLLSVCISLKDHKPRIEKQHGDAHLNTGFLVHCNQKTVAVNSTGAVADASNAPDILNYADFDNDRIFRQHLYARLT